MHDFTISVQELDKPKGAVARIFIIKYVDIVRNSKNQQRQINDSSNPLFSL